MMITIQSSGTRKLRLEDKLYLPCIHKRGRMCSYNALVPITFPYTEVYELFVKSTLKHDVGVLYCACGGIRSNWQVANWFVQLC